MAAVAESAVRSSGDRNLMHHSPPPSRQNSDLQRDVRQLVDLLSKLNPSAKEFFPSAYPSSPATSPHQQQQRRSNGALSADAPVFVVPSDYSNSVKDSSSDGSTGSFRRRRINHGQGKRRVNDKVLRAQREDRIRRTVYVSDIDHFITEEQLAALFTSCGQVLDCRICGDPNSVLRFAFIEFSDERGARESLNLAGTMLGYYPVRVLPSKTAILPVNPTFLPKSDDEKEMCTRTIYCTNIDKKATQAEVKQFFETTCGEVSRLRLLGDHVHSTRIAFVEFVMAESAIVALNCSGLLLKSLPIRVSPSKTPVRSRIPRAMMS